MKYFRARSEIHKIKHPSDSTKNVVVNLNNSPKKELKSNFSKRETIRLSSKSSKNGNEIDEESSFVSEHSDEVCFTRSITNFK